MVLTTLIVFWLYVSGSLIVALYLTETGETDVGVVIVSVLLWPVIVIPTGLFVTIREQIRVSRREDKS